MPRRAVTPRPTPAELGEHASRLARLADDPELIPGVHQYCDRWCERCTLTARCLSFQLDQARQAVLAAARRDPARRTFWSHLTRQLSGQLRSLDREDRPGSTARAPMRTRPVSSDHPWHTTDAAAALLRDAARYRQEARTLLLRLPSALAEVQRELHTQSQLGTGDPPATASAVREALEVVEWFVFFIEAKLQRATTARAEEAGRPVAEQPSDADGSAKVALIGVDRSTGAWATLREHCPREADAILDLLVQLERLRSTTEQAFPSARQFRRPGFD